MNETQTFGDISRESLDASDAINYETIASPGVHESVVRQISAANNEPEWMLEIRLKSLKKYQEMPMPKWGPDLSGLKLDEIFYFAKAEGSGDSRNWDEVPEKIKATFDRL